MKHRSSQRDDGRFFPRGRASYSLESVGGFAGRKARYVVQINAHSNRAVRQFAHFRAKFVGLSFATAQQLGDTVWVEVVGCVEEIAEWYNIAVKRGFAVDNTMETCIASHVPTGNSGRPWSCGSGAKKRFARPDRIVAGEKLADADDEVRIAKKKTDKFLDTLYHEVEVVE